MAGKSPEWTKLELSPPGKEKSSTVSSQPTWTRHETFYFEDGNIILLAETTLFKLHKSLLLFSPFFQDLLSLQQPVGEATQGTSDTNPIDISAQDLPSELKTSCITSEDFSDFLSVFLPMTKVDVKRSSECWARVLKTASMLQFDSIRILALSNLDASSADPILKISLGVQHDHRKFVIEGIKDLSLAPTPLPIEAALKLDTMSFYHLVSAREAIRTHLTFKVTSDDFSWNCISGRCSGSSYVLSEHKKLITQPLPVERPEGVDYKRAVQALVKDTLVKDHDLCDHCQTVWDTSIGRLLDLEKVEKIIGDQIDSSRG